MSKKVSPNNYYKFKFVLTPSLVQKLGLCEVRGGVSIGRTCYKQGYKVKFLVVLDLI